MPFSAVTQLDDADAYLVREFDRVLVSPLLNVFVRRGPHWNHGDEDDNGLIGVTVPDLQEDEYSGSHVWVRWFNGTMQRYSVGYQGKYDLYLSYASILMTTQLGINVQRGPDWAWEDRSGHVVGTTVEGAVNDGQVAVQWPNGDSGVYRVAEDGFYDLIVEPQSSVSQARERQYEWGTTVQGIVMDNGQTLQVMTPNINGPFNSENIFLPTHLRGMVVLTAMI
jgi:hypothetical protein